MVTTEDTLPLLPEKPVKPRRRWWTVVVWLTVMPFAIWAATRTLGLDSGFPAVQLIAFTPYVAAASLLPLLVAVLTKRLWPALAAALATIALAACVLPRWVADSSPEPDGGPAIRVLSVNMLFGGADPATIVGLIKKYGVDLVALQEYTPEARDALRSAGLEEMLPNAVSYPRPGVTGSAVYSRFPVADLGYRRFESGFGQARAGVLVPGAADVRVESVHTCAPSDAARSGCWERDIAQEPAATPDGPVSLLIGDFNATLDHEGFRSMLAKGYRDAADVVGAGFEASWPFDERWFVPGVTLDHVVADKRVGVRTVTVHRMPNSDHKAVFAELVLPKGAA
ncbi:endonuclease/exonuclease/phosphatase family protein [Dactylosporangium sp. NPDC000555]|uniref:endonuclease/exonuclease/phosphatase family protein n=1 Tax=Dactylosporangium sp. NPDC000555 TaxID=3154260 RepID=UPI0033264171